MCVGLLPTERVLSAKAQGVGNALVLYGAFTGRDGIGGASVLASQDLEGSDEKRPSVQIGDPFRGKALIEVSLELVERELVVSLQDCGAAGLASSLSEMARDGMGVDVHLDRVPLREERPRAVGDHDLRVAGADGRGRRARARRRGACRVRALGASLHGDRRGDRPRRAARVRRRRDRRLDPGCAPHRRVPALRRRADTASGRAGAASTPVNDEPKDVGVRAVRPARRLAHRAPARARRRRAARRRRRAGSPSRSTGRRSAAATRSRPAGAPSSRRR